MKYKIILGLLLVCLGISISFVVGSNPAFCVIENGCDVVKNSSYAYTFGINNGYYGIVTFAILSILLFWHIKKPSNNKRIILNTALAIGSIIALRFIYIQAFVLESYCTSCLIIDTAVLISVALIIQEEIHNRELR